MFKTKTKTKTKTRTTPAETVRLRLDPNPSRGTLLDGGWWPHSTDAATELPALVDALAGARGNVTSLLVHGDDWDLPHPRRMVARGLRVRVGWFTSQPAGLVTVVCDAGKDRFDLFVVPPAATAASAEAGMTAAADAGNDRHVQDLLAATDVRG
jgi:hypothetical protein